MKLSLKSLTTGLQFHGEVEGKRQRYFVRLRGRRGLTAKLVFVRSKNRRLVPSHLAALNMLYVLVATGRASMDTRRASREIFFNVKKS